MMTKKICLTVDERLYKRFQNLYPRSLRQAIEEVMARSIKDDDFLWNFLHHSLFVDDLRTVKIPDYNVSEV